MLLRCISPNAQEQTETHSKSVFPEKLLQFFRHGTSGETPKTLGGQSYLEAWSLCVARVVVVSPDFLRPSTG